MKLSIVYITGRKTPLWEWWCDSFCNQVSADERSNVQVTFVDSLLWNNHIPIGVEHEHASEIRLLDEAFYDPARVKQLADVVAGRFHYQHIPVKPCVWQGPFRLTKENWFAASATRNTGIIFSRHEHICFADDLSVLMPTWWAAVKEAVARNDFTCGAYAKQKEMVVKNGALISYTEHPGGRDHRWNYGCDDRAVPGHASWTFGCSFVAPVSALLSVNGYDENADSLGLEDSLLGIRLSNAGWRSFSYDRRLCTVESEEHHHCSENRYLRRDKGVSPNDKSHALLKMAQNSKWAPNYFSHGGIASVRDKALATGLVPIVRIPQHDFYDGQPLCEMQQD
jgi:hypothetical protein